MEQEKFITLNQFNDILKLFKDNRKIRVYKPTSINAGYLYIWEDSQHNYHLAFNIFKDDKVLTHHYAVDAYKPFDEETAKEHNEDDHTGFGRKAIKLAKTLCQKYGEDFDYAKNKDYVNVKYFGKKKVIIKDLTVTQYNWFDRDYRGQWIDKVWSYDMRSCFPYFLQKPLPTGDIIRYNDFVNDNEIGFRYGNDTNTGKTTLITVFPKDNFKAEMIFKTKIYKGLTKYAVCGFKMKEQDKSFKPIYNSFVGSLKNHNIFMRAAVLGYAERYITSLRDENTIMITTDSITSLVPRPDIPVGNDLGQFKCEYPDGASFFYESTSAKMYDTGNIDDVKYAGMKKSRFIDSHHYYSLGLIGFDYINKELKYIKEREGLITTLWPREEK